jgi:hypothetical protein
MTAFRVRRDCVRCVITVKAAADGPSRPPDSTYRVCPLVFVDEAAEDGTALDLLLGEVRNRVVGAGRVEMPAAVGAASVVVGLVLGQD